MKMNSLYSKLQSFDDFLAKTSQEEIDKLLSPLEDVVFDSPSVEDYFIKFESNFLLFNEFESPIRNYCVGFCHQITDSNYIEILSETAKYEPKKLKGFSDFNMEVCFNTEFDYAMAA